MNVKRIYNLLILATALIFCGCDGVNEPEPLHNMSLVTFELEDITPEGSYPGISRDLNDYLVSVSSFNFAYEIIDTPYVDIASGILLPYGQYSARIHSKNSYCERKEIEGKFMDIYSIGFATGRNLYVFSPEVCLRLMFDVRQVGVEVYDNN